MFPPQKHFEYTYNDCYNNATNNSNNNNNNNDNIQCHNVNSSNNNNDNNTDNYDYTSCGLGTCASLCVTPNLPSNIIPTKIA